MTPTSALVVDLYKIHDNLIYGLRNRSMWEMDWL